MLYLPLVLSATEYVKLLVKTLNESLTPVSPIIIIIPANILPTTEIVFGIINVINVTNIHADIDATIVFVSSYAPALIQIQLYILFNFRSNT